MNALTLHQPYATLVALGVKTIETRSWPAPKSAIGQRLAIHAGATDGMIRHGGSVGAWRTYRGDGQRNTRSGFARPAQMYRGEERVVLPLGAVVASAILTDCIPTHDTCAEPIPDDLIYVTIDGRALYRQIVTGDPWVESNVHQHDITHQLPYGDFRPGRWAWLLGDVKATTERCPACWGTCEFVDDIEMYGRTETRHYPCLTCDGAGRCEPIPAKGHQRIWRWEPQ